MLAEKLEVRICLSSVIDLDPSIGEQGFIETNTGFDFQAINRDGDQLVVVSGDSIWRYNLDGSPQSDFGENGVKDLGLRGSYSYQPLSNGGFLAWGTIYRDSDGNLLELPLYELRRYDRQGELDSTFSEDGVSSIDLDLRTVIPADDGSVYVAGWRYQGEDSTFALTHFLANGNLDNSFGDAGYQSLGLSIIATDQGFITPDGKILLQVNGHTKEWRRYLADGSVDESFGTGGAVEAVLPDNHVDYGQTIMDAQGRLYVRYEEENGDNYGPGTIARLLPDGSIDTTFADGGAFHVQRDAGFDSFDFEVNPDGSGTVYLDQMVGSTSYTYRQSFNGSGEWINRTSDVVFPFSCGEWVTPSGEKWINASQHGWCRLTNRPDQELTENGCLILTTSDSADTISIREANQQLRVSINGAVTNYPLASVNRIDLFTGGGNDTVTISGALQSRINTSLGNDAVTTASGNDDINTLVGNDTVHSGDGTDNINTGDGDDEIVAEQANAPRNILTGAGNNALTVNGGNNTIFAQGSVTILPATSAEQLPTDFVRVEGSVNHLHSDFSVSVSADGDHDLIETSDLADSISLSSRHATVRAGGGDDTISGDGAGNYLVYAGNENDEIDLRYQSGDCTIFGEAGDDRFQGGDLSTPANMVLHGGDGNDYFIGGNGNDSIYGEGGRDELRGGYGNDLISGGGGKDKIFGSYGNDRLYGGKGNDQIDGGPGRDKLDGGEGDDKLFGQNGNDTLTGGAGSDQLFGNKMDDVFFAQDGEADSVFGGTGVDRVESSDAEDLIKFVENS